MLQTPSGQGTQTQPPLHGIARPVTTRRWRLESAPLGGLAPRNTEGCLASRHTASLRCSSRCSAKASPLEALGLASPLTFVLNRYFKTLPRCRQGPLRPLSNRPFEPSNAVWPLRLGASSSDRIVPGVSATSPNTSRCRASLRRSVPSLLAADAFRYSPSRGDSKRPTAQVHGHAPRALSNADSPASWRDQCLWFVPDGSYPRLP